MRIVLLTLFPEYFDSLFRVSIIGKALAAKKAEIEVIPIRDFADDTQRTTDDRPFGGGPGMVMKVEPIARAIESVKKTLTSESKVAVILTSAQGSEYTQETAKNFSTYDVLIIICGHYEGVDERVVELFVEYEVRIGNYVLTGGEPAAAVLVDSVVRLLPGVLGNAKSTQGESHDEMGKLGYPQYTRPQNYQGHSVPEVLLSGNHKKIQEWREAHRKVRN